MRHGYHLPVIGGNLQINFLRVDKPKIEGDFYLDFQNIIKQLVNLVHQLRWITKIDFVNQGCECSPCNAVTIFEIFFELSPIYLGNLM